MMYQPAWLKALLDIQAEAQNSTHTALLVTRWSKSAMYLCVL